MSDEAGPSNPPALSSLREVLGEQHGDDYLWQLLQNAGGSAEKAIAHVYDPPPTPPPTTVRDEVLAEVLQRNSSLEFHQVENLVDRFTFTTKEDGVAQVVASLVKEANQVDLIRGIRFEIEDLRKSLALPNISEEDVRQLLEVTRSNHPGANNQVRDTPSVRVLTS